MKKKVKKRIIKSEKEIIAPVWILDGFVGILALMVYNFLLYLLTAIGIEGIIGQLEDSMGYFGLNTFIDLSFNNEAISLGIIIVFLIAFILGILIGNLVRKRRKKH